PVLPPFPTRRSSDLGGTDQIDDGSCCDMHSSVPVRPATMRTTTHHADTFTWTSRADGYREHTTPPDGSRALRRRITIMPSLHMEDRKSTRLNSSHVK